MAVAIKTSYFLGEFELEPDSRRLSVNGNAIHLTKKPFGVLLYLIENRERMVSRHELLENFWDGHDVYEETLTKCVGAIRKALNDRGENPRFIETHWAEGYRFIGPVEEQLGQPSSSIQIERTRSLHVLIEEDDSDKRLDIRQPRGKLIAARRKFWPWTAAIACLVFGLAGALYLRMRATSPSSQIASIAILPLRNLSGNMSEEYFSDGVTESIIAELSQIRELKIVPRTTAFRYKGGDDEPQDIGRRLNVAAVLVGSVRKEGSSVRVAVRLISTDDGRILWSNESRNRGIEDIFAVQDEIAKGVIAKLGYKLNGNKETTLARRNTNDVEAYQLFLKGRFYWNQLTEDSLRRSIEYYNLAINKDPNFALAYTGLADSYIILAQDFMPPIEVLPKAKAAAARAIELDPTLADAHISMGSVKLFLEWDWAGARLEADRAKELDPAYQATIEVSTNYGDGHHFYCGYLEAIGQADEAIDEIRKAREIDPLSTMLVYELGWSYYAERRYDEALELADQLLQPESDIYMAYLLRANVYEQKGMYDKAIADLNKARTLPSGDVPAVMAELGFAYASSGKKAEAKEIVENLKLRSKREFIDPFNMALIYIATGNRKEAFAWLAKAVDSHSVLVVYLNIEPKCDPLRSDPRFSQLLKQVGLV